MKKILREIRGTFLCDINHIVKWSQPPSYSYYADPDVNQMIFQVTDAALYYKNMGKLVEDISAFNPDVIMIGWCYSQFGDVSLALRRSSQFSKMTTTHELMSSQHFWKWRR